MRRLSPLVALVLFISVFSIAGRARPARAAALPSISIGSASVIEGDMGSAVVNIPVDLSAPSSVTVTVKYVVHGDTATPSSDFVTKTGKLTFVVGGVVSKYVSVRVYGDAVPEPGERVLVSLSNPVNATLENSQGEVTINDDDSDANTGLQVSIGDFTVLEADAGAHYAYLPVTLSRPAPSSVKVHYAITCSTADDGVDYVFKATGTLTFLKGQQTKQLKFKINADMAVQDAVSILETITVALGPATAHTTAGDATIIDDDGVSTPPGGGGVTPLPVYGVERESVNSSGIGGQSPDPEVCSSSSFGARSGPSISADGRYVAFISDATNLVPDDNNGEWDAFVRDRVTGAVERVSVASDGSETAPNGISGAPYPGADDVSISADGRYVTFFEYRAVGAYPGYRLFIHDRQAGTTVPLLYDSSGQLADADTGPQIAPMSTDGRYVVFSACGDSSPMFVATDRDPPHPPEDGAACDVLALDRDTGVYTLVSNPPDGSPSDGTFPSISADGRYVAFYSSNPNYVPGDTNGCSDAFVRDMVTGTFERINVTTAGAQEQSYAGECTPFPSWVGFSADGRYLAFSSSAWNLAGLGTPTSWTSSGTHVYLRDRVAGTTTMLDQGGQVRAIYPAISADGAYVAYTCTFCLDGERFDVVTNVATGETIRASELPDGSQGDGDDGPALNPQALSADGSYFVFTSGASNLDPNDDNNMADVFVKRVH